MEPNLLEAFGHILSTNYENRTAAGEIREHSTSTALAPTHDKAVLAVLASLTVVRERMQEGMLFTCCA